MVASGSTTIGSLPEKPEPIVVDWVRPVVFEIWDVPIYNFGMFMCMAFLACFHLAGKEFHRLRLRVDPGLLLFGAVVGGLLGAKLHFAFHHVHDPIQFAKPGLMWQGGAMGGTLLVFLILKFWYTNEPYMRVLDVAAPLVPLGHAIGKIGCFTSGDGCYGPATSLPWGMAFPNGKRPTKEGVHPTPLYELALSMTVFTCLWKRRNNAMNFRSDQTTMMLLLHSTTRFLSEYWRDHDHDGIPLAYGEFTGQQMICVLGILLAASIRFYQRYQPWLKKRKRG